ncbi:hypothetical protein SCHPADRAFT_917113 [Schizopora paradoxa]|uniref:Tetraspanin Tsp2 n=1 Tax=Schizopora paradoxa TaxID=27342 RepID=A0A0H2RE32_9AGAM|nr:hypothetical protein SCHPADRAFT_917113 [Schizopora paradoxa]
MSTSLSLNYIPTKFSGPLTSDVVKRRNVPVHKQGGGREAFRRRESRMPRGDDEDYDGVENVRQTWFGGPPGAKKKKRLRWNAFKWILFTTNFLLMLYSIIAFIFCLLTWFNVWNHADIVRVGNRPELIVSTFASCVGIVTSLVGWSGILLNNRSFLAVYNLLLWATFALLVTPGYITYKQRTFNLEGKVNAQWSQGIGLNGRLRIQNQLDCCGYFSPFVEATVSNTCYARSVLPGCKNGYLQFEKLVLMRWYTVAFSLVPLQLAAMFAGLICSNHVTFRFGKGMMPKAYRLGPESMATMMDSYANQLAEQYGPDVASAYVSRNDLNFNSSLPSLPHTPSTGSVPPAYSAPEKRGAPSARKN